VGATSLPLLPNPAQYSQPWEEPSSIFYQFQEEARRKEEEDAQGLHLVKP
jgi:hypothetical protein